MLLTDQIYHDMFVAILRGEFLPGSKFLTEQEAMTRYSASRITVRRAFAKLEENRVIIRKPKIGSVITTSFGAFSGKLTQIAAVVPLKSHFVRSFLAELCREAAQRDIITVLEPAASGREQNEALIRLVLHGIRDIVVWGVDKDVDMELCLRLRILGVNLTFFDQIDPGNIADYVCLDNRAAIAALMAKASGLGAKNVFFAADKNMDADTNKERFTACRDMALERNWSFCAEIPAHFPPHSVIFATNDETAFEFAACGVPVFSIDGLEKCREHGIISYRQPMQDLARSCFESLLKQRKLGSKWRAKQYRLQNSDPFA